MSALETLVRETRFAFMTAKEDGHLEISEVIQIAVDLVQKIRKVPGLSLDDEKALLLHALKKGLDSAGGVMDLPAFRAAPQETLVAFEEQLLAAASTAVDMVLSAASGKMDIRTLTSASTWKACLPFCFSAATALLPKDLMVLADATKKDYDDVIKVSVPTAEEVPKTEVPAAEVPAAEVPAADVQTEVSALPGNPSKESQ
jgi:hypothetical protein